MRTYRLVCIAWIACCVLAPGTARGQSANGAIAGVVTDTTGAVLPGATVEASSPALIEKVRTVVTDDKGEYKIVDLRPGTYTVTFTLSGFATTKRQGIELTTGFTARANGEMKVGALEETVTVTGASPVVDVQNVRTQNVLSHEVLETLPNGRTTQAFAALTLGASISASSQDVGGDKGEAPLGLAIHGSRQGDMKLLQDGMSYNAPSLGNSSSNRIFLVNQMNIQETTLSTSATTAETETGGIQVNFVPKDGGNVFKGSFLGNYVNEDFQSDNLSDEARARGLRTAVPLKQVWDWGAGFGGRIVQDRLWFYTAHRWWGSQNYQPGVFFNATQNSLFYTADTSRPGFTNLYNEDHSVRLTWQATAKQKVGFTSSFQNNCLCLYYSHTGATVTAPEAAGNFYYKPVYLLQGTWSYPVTSRLLLDAGATYGRNRLDGRPTDGVSVDDISILELSTGLAYHGRASGNFSGGFGSNGACCPGGWDGNQGNERFSLSYVTGSHAFKTGMQSMRGTFHDFFEVADSLSYQFRSGVPVAVSEWLSPGDAFARVNKLALFAQDQWTVKHLTLNLGVRFDYLHSYIPDQHLAATRFVPAADFARVDDVPNWNDVVPRFGAAYDVFGNGRTAIKGTLGKYVISMGTLIAQMNNPSSTLVGSTTRTWADGNGNYVPDCDLPNPAANGECGAVQNGRFGTTSPTTFWAPDVLHGWGARDYNWQVSAVLQQELAGGVGLNVGYFRTWYGNFTATENQAVTPAEYSPYCFTAPADARLPGGGGNQICGLYDVVPAKFGQVRNLVTQASNFGEQTEVFNGVDVGLNARFGHGGQLAGGLSTARTVTDNCLGATLPNLLVGGQQQIAGFCKVTPPWSAATQVKLAGSYPMPWGFQASGTFQNLPGVQDLGSIVLTNAQVAPSLGRNLAAGVNGTAIANLFPAGTLYEARLNQLDVRLTKLVTVARLHVRGNVDVYNVFNASTILGVNTRYGPAWLQPTAILGGRLVKFGGQVDF